MVGDRWTLYSSSFPSASLQRSPDLVVGDRKKALGIRGRVTMLQRSPDLVVGDRFGVWHASARIVGFNGAPTSWSGIVPLLGDPALTKEASTEPRPRGRGSSTSGSCAGAQSTLQRSPDLVVGDRKDDYGVIAYTRELQRSPDLVVGDRTTGHDYSHWVLELQRSPDLVVGDRPRPSRRCARGTRFNGAPTSWSGIGPGAGRDHRCGYRASTEPRPRGRGSSDGRREPQAPARASTEPRPRGRGSTAALPSAEKVGRLQRSPDLVVGDRRRGAVRGHHPGPASTEPRPRGRGSLVHRRGRATAGGRASTEPRPRGRGSHDATDKADRPIAALQRSPDLVVGDRRCPAHAISATKRFNGAPTSWSGIEPPEKPKAELILSMAVSSGPRISTCTAREAARFVRIPSSCTAKALGKTRPRAARRSRSPPCRSQSASTDSVIKERPAQTTLGFRLSSTYAFPRLSNTSAPRPSAGPTSTMSTWSC